MDKNKKKTLTISTNLKKKIDTSSISSGNKKSYSVEKKNHSSQVNLSTGKLVSQISILILTERRKISQENLLNNRQLKSLLKKTTNLLEKVNLN